MAVQTVGAGLGAQVATVSLGACYGAGATFHGTASLVYSQVASGHSKNWEHYVLDHPYTGSVADAIAHGHGAGLSMDSTCGCESRSFEESGGSNAWSGTLVHTTDTLYLVAVPDWVASDWYYTTQGSPGCDITAIHDSGATVTCPTAPTADFSGTPLSGPPGLSVAFTDLSLSSPTSWAWDFGDGGTSTSQNPTHVYAAPGTYTVALTATNAHGSDTETKVAYVVVASSSGTDIYHPVPPGDTIEFVGTLDDADDVKIRPVLNAPGSGSFTINRRSPNAAFVQPGNLVRVRIDEIDDDYIFAFWMDPSRTKLVSIDEEGGEVIQCGGDGAMAYWQRAIWLASRFTIPWWTCTDDPDPGDRGQVTVAPGTYRFYTVASGVITGFTNHTVGSTDCWYFDTRRTYVWPGANANGTDAKRFLVHLTSGPHAGAYFHPHQAGVTELLATYAVGSSIDITTISPDTPGAVLYQMYLEATDPARPTQPVPLMTVDFTATHDSNGDPWATTDALAGVTIALGEDYLTTLMKLVATGVIDVEMTPDLVQHAYNAQGRDLTSSTFASGKVRFAKGYNIADEVLRERADVPVATFIEVIGTENVVAQAVLPDAASRVAREVSGTADSNDTTVLEAAGLAQLNARLIISDAVGFNIATGDDDAAGLYLPGPPGTDHGDFWLGDLVTLHTGTDDQDFDEADERVYAISIKRDGGGNLDVTPELGSILGAAERALYGRSTTIVTGGGGVATGDVSGGDSVLEDQTAADIAYTPTAPRVATNVQTAIDEVAATTGVPTSPISIRYTFSTTTTDSDPGSGNLRLSNATQASAVTARCDLADVAGVDVTTLLDAIATAGTGYLRLQKRDDPTKWLVATVSASASPSGYRNITIANISKSANSPFANGDAIVLSFVPTGGGGGGSGTLTTVEEVDGSPTDSAVTKIVFPNGTLTIVGHVATYTPSGGGGGGQIVLSDSFNRANGAVGDADGGPLQHWYVFAGTWNIDTNGLRETTGSSERFVFCFTGYAHAKRTIVWTLKTKPASGDGGLFWRSEGPAGPNGLLLNIEATYKLYTRIAGSYTAVTVVSGTPVAPVNGDVITVVDDGTRVTVTVNGGAAVVYDTAWMPGQFTGFRSSGGTTMTHDSIVVTDT